MLNLRLYRAAWLPVLFCLVIVGFSLTERPRGIETTVPPDAFDGPRAARTLEGLARRFPDRRPGSAGDTGLADRVRQGFVRSFGASRVRERRFTARTIDGERGLRTVIAERPGRLGRRIVILAHRDAAARGAKAELSATAALLELADVFGGRVTEHTITLVSTSGGSGGDAGADDYARHAGGPVDAVIVLGDLASTATRRPWIVPWSNALGSAPLRLQQTADRAIDQEVAPPGEPRLAMKFLRLAFPLTTSEQGPLNAAGLPAVLIGPGGERGPKGDDTISADRLRVFGRAALRVVTALDNGPDIRPAPATGVVIRNQFVPEWAMRLLVASLLLPALVGAVDGLARVKRRRGRPGLWMLWTLAAAVPFLAAALFAVILRALDLLGSAPGAPVAPDHVPIGGLAIAATLIVLGAGWVFGRGAIVARLGLGRPVAPDAAAGVAVTSVAVIALVWLRNPYSAGLLVPAAHLWLLTGAPEVHVGRARALALALAGLLPLALAILGYCIALRAGPVDVTWLAVLAIAGGHVSPLGILLGSVVLGCGVSAVALALRRSAPPKSTISPPDVVSRGPLTYAGPGSLGGTKSALRR